VNSNIVRSSLTLLLLASICHTGVAHSEPADPSSPAAVQPAIPTATSLQACLWTWRSDGATEARFVVDLATEKAGAEEGSGTGAKQAPDCARSGIERKKRDLAVYERLKKRFDAQRAHSEPDKRLAHAIQWIERSTKWGASRANWMVASPDGAYAVYTIHGEPLLLIDVDALATRVLAAATVGSNLATPVAWSADSRELAYAPPHTDQVQIYSVAQQAVTASKTGAGPWVLALAWSPDGRQLATFGFVNRRMNKSPLGLLGAAAGHPEFRNDGQLSVYTMGQEEHLAVVLKRGISEMGSPNIELEWK